ncbi:hypothetical protein TNIN_113161 [Trichonephila inaurata madagascariensis]|uniref:Uncharacterized protein n=1 Tax=Trichonephila inaurata madagascariensis TaxID=2747483 RepID=A0A8X6XX29_9ARAC|nr:hypothetical protein TNIN_113161 [Trichonephila inaurata madagascariensis]
MTRVPTQNAAFDSGVKWWKVSPPPSKWEKENHCPLHGKNTRCSRLTPKTFFLVLGVLSGQTSGTFVSKNVVGDVLSPAHGDSQILSATSSMVIPRVCSSKIPPSRHFQFEWRPSSSFLWDVLHLPGVHQGHPYQIFFDIPNPALDQEAVMNFPDTPRAHSLADNRPTSPPTTNSKRPFFIPSGGQMGRLVSRFVRKPFQRHLLGLQRPLTQWSIGTCAFSPFRILGKLRILEDKEKKTLFPSSNSLISSLSYLFE